MFMGCREAAERQQAKAQGKGKDKGKSPESGNAEPAREDAPAKKKAKKTQLTDPPTPKRDSAEAELEVHTLCKRKKAEQADAEKKNWHPAAAARACLRRV